MKVLVIEDNEKNLKLFSLIIRSLGHEALTAANGESGIMVAREESPALILMDIQMPVMDGLAALNILKSDEKTRDIPVIALTSYAMEGDRGRFLEAGFHSYVSKPIDVAEFSELIRSILVN